MERMSGLCDARCARVVHHDGPGATDCPDSVRPDFQRRRFVDANAEQRGTFQNDGEEPIVALPADEMLTSIPRI
jgi:hypothetical protein